MPDEGKTFSFGFEKLMTSRENTITVEIPLFQTPLTPLLLEETSCQLDKKSKEKFTVDFLNLQIFVSLGGIPLNE